MESNAKEDTHYCVEKIRHPKVKVDGKNVNDKSTIIYNGRITIKNIPSDAYLYVVNGKPAIDWVMERQYVKTDTDSGIESDANVWATKIVKMASQLLL
ncbi:type ISP restriction/modification enzyme [Tolumonas osonensis]|uniref:type ISP restriction/modification enzyme n=1 Tax=Tolumonas osonensis TaxID=675874 RepID=UPI0031B5F475